MYDNDLVPLGICAYELGTSMKDLLGRVNGALTRGVYGERCIPGELFAQLIEERDAELVRKHRAEHKAAAQRKAFRAEQKAQREAEQARRIALRRKQRPLMESGMGALDVMLADEAEAQWNRAALDREDMTPRRKEVTR